MTVDADCVLLAIGQTPDLQLADPACFKPTEHAISVLPGQVRRKLARRVRRRGRATGPASVIEAIAAGRRAAVAIDLLLSAGSHSRRQRRPQR